MVLLCWGFLSCCYIGVNSVVIHGAVLVAFFVFVFAVF